MIESELTDSRTSKNTRQGLLALLRQFVYSRLAGYDDTNHKPVFFLEMLKCLIIV